MGARLLSQEDFIRLTQDLSNMRNLPKIRVEFENYKDKIIINLWKSIFV